MAQEMQELWYAMKDTQYQQVLAKLKRNLENSVDVSEALQFSINSVVDAVHAVAGTFWFYDRFGENLIYPRAVYGGKDLGGIQLKPGEGIAGQVIETGKPVIVENCQADIRWAGKSDAATGFITKSMICVPMFIDDLCFGCIQIINKTDNIAFDEKDLDLTTKLSQAAATTLSQRKMLPGYSETVDESEEKDDFEVIFLASSLNRMRKELQKEDCFRKLGVHEKMKVLDLAEQMYDVFMTSDTVQKEKKGFFHRF